MSFERLYPVFLYFADLRVLRVHRVDGVDPEQADLKILFLDVAVGCFKVDVRQVKVHVPVFAELSFDGQLLHGGE